MSFRLTWTWLEASNGIKHAYEARRPAGQATGLRFDPLCGDDSSAKTMKQDGAELCCACWLAVRRRLLQGQ